MKSLKNIPIAAVIAAIGFFPLTATSQHSLFIPDTLSGKTFDLTVQTGFKEFFAGKQTPTYGYNGAFLGPTLIINKGDAITLNVNNKLNQPTTVHWHGFHVSPENDGGPHQLIEPNTTWSPSFTMLNEAATFWYHPHGEGKTEIQISRGLAGMIIVRDEQEKQLALPRTYGVDDFPLIIQSRAFDVLQQIATATHEDSIMMVNGIIDPYLEVPKQVVRLRLLNASADRSYYLGLSDNSTFSLIASDGGLLTTPHLTNRIRLSTGERVEILIDFGKYALGEQVFLKSYASELPHGIIGADTVGTADMLMGEGYYDNPLNGNNFNILRLDVIQASPTAITSIPSTLVTRELINQATTNAYRTILFEPDTAFGGPQSYVDGPFLMNKKSFHMDSINLIIHLNDTEIWTLINKTGVAHPFHIHDIQFQVLDINGSKAPAEYSGLKDVMLVKPNDTVRFITKFETFADNHIPYMFHCHLLHHEDEGMMGSFLVIDTLQTRIINTPSNNYSTPPFPNPANNYIQIPVQEETQSVSVYNFLGQEKQLKITANAHPLLTIDTSDWDKGIYLIKTNKHTYHKVLINH